MEDFATVSIDIETLMNNMTTSEAIALIRKIDSWYGDWDFTYNVFRMLYNDMQGAIKNKALDVDHMPEDILTILGYVFVEPEPDLEEEEEPESNEIVKTLDDDRRHSIIDEIRMFYPPDNNEHGPELLWKAICKNWRDMPTSVLETLRSLSLDKDWE